MTAPLRLAVLADFLEERWPSMDAVAEGAVAGLQSRGDLGVAPQLVRPAFAQRALRLPALGRTGLARTVDRGWNRYVRYPRLVRALRDDFDLFHVADHTYAHLALELPPERVGVFCHDLDAFHLLLDADAGAGTPWMRAIARRTLRGLQRAAVVFHSTDVLRRDILRLGLVDERKLVLAPYGVPHTAARGDRRVIRVPDWAGTGPYVLHVGSTIPRKRVDVLLDVFARVAATRPGLRLVQVGGRWTDAHLAQIARHGIEDVVLQRRGVSSDELCALYRGCAVAVLTSDAEGFGLPVVEALAAGAPVVVSDLPVLREVAGDAALYCPSGDVAAWSRTLGALLDGRLAAPARAERVARGCSFTWEQHATELAAAYSALASARPTDGRRRRTEVPA